MIEKIARLTTDGSAKQFTNKSLGMMTDEVLPYIFSRKHSCLKEM